MAKLLISTVFCCFFFQIVNGQETRERIEELKEATLKEIDYANKMAARIAHEGFERIRDLADSVYYRSLSGMVEFSTSRAS